MRQFKTAVISLIFLTLPAFGQTFPYVLQTFAGTFPLGDGGPANSALLYYPNAVVTDSAGNIFILDSSNFLIRKVTSDRRITTFARLDIYTYDMKRGADGTLYVGGVGQVLKVSTTGVVTPIAGNGTYGYAGDGGPALSAQVGDVYGLTVDSVGQVYFSDASSSS